jgi:hypothetical protein
MQKLPKLIIFLTYVIKLLYCFLLILMRHCCSPPHSVVFETSRNDPRQPQPALVSRFGLRRYLLPCLA